jgi:hypothetical protein
LEDPYEELLVKSKEDLRRILETRLEPTIERMNDALAGRNLAELEATLKRVGKNSELPHWFKQLKADASLPNLDGKTIGSVVEMLLVAVIETSTFKDLSLPPFKINPARGVDLPDLDLGVKSPSENFCTSEPFFSGYERILGSDHDALVLITDYQQKKNTPPLKLQIAKYHYLTKTQLADKRLCSVARKLRDWLVDENPAWAKRVLKFLAYINQSDWRAKQILKMVGVLDDESEIKKIILKSKKDFEAANKSLAKKGRPALPDLELESIASVASITPIKSGVTEIQKELSRGPNDNEWERYLSGPLDGMIGVSLALQWRYNFGQLFKAPRVRGSGGQPMKPKVESQ